MRALHPRAARRASTRGAALVEAAVVIPMMVVFLGTTMFAYQSYAAKFDQQAGARTDALSFASNDCEGGSNGVQLSSESVGGALGQEAMGNMNQLANGLGSGGSTAASRTKNSASVERTQTVDGRAVTNGSSMRFTRRISSRSELLCNEKPFQDIWKTVLGKAKSIVSSGMGF